MIIIMVIIFNNVDALLTTCKYTHSHIGSVTFASYLKHIKTYVFDRSNHFAIIMFAGQVSRLIVFIAASKQYGMCCVCGACYCFAAN